MPCPSPANAAIGCAYFLTSVRICRAIRSSTALTSFGSSSSKKALGDLDIFGDDDGDGHVLALGKLERAGPQDGADGAVEPRQRPVVLKGRADQRIELTLVAHDAGNDRAEPGGVRLQVGLAVDFLAETVRLVFGDDFEHAGAADIHLVERLDGSEPGRAALVGLLDRR